MPPQNQTQVPVTFVIVNGKRVAIPAGETPGIPDFDPNEFAQPIPDFDPNEFAQEQQEPIRNPYYQSPFEFEPTQPTPQQQAPPPPSYYESPYAVRPGQDPWPQKQKEFNPDEMSDLERLVLGLPPKQQQDPWYHPDRLIPMALRGAGGVAGGVLGGTAGSIVPGAGTLAGAALGGGAGSYIGDALAQGYEYLRGDRPEGYDVRSGLVEGGLGAIPLMGKAPGLTATAKEWFKHAAVAPFRGAAEGAFVGGLSPVAHSLVEKGELPTWGEVGTGAGVGAGVGAVTAGGLASVPAVRRGRSIQATAAQGRANRNQMVSNILEGAEYPIAPPADLPPIRPEGTVDLPVKRTPVVQSQTFEPGTMVMIQDLPGIYEVTGSVSPNTTAVRSPDGPVRIERNDHIIPIAEPPAIPIKLSPETQALQDRANQTGHIVDRIQPERGTPVVHDPKLGGFQHHVRGGEHWVTHPMLPEPKGPFPTSDAAFDWTLDFQETPAFQRHLDEYNARREQEYAPEVPIKPPTQELQFVDPNTGEIRAKGEQQPGDIPLPPQENVQALHEEAENWERDVSAGPAVDPRIVADLVRRVTGQDANVYGMHGGNLTPRDTAPTSRQLPSSVGPELVTGPNVKHGDTVELAISETGQTFWVDQISDPAQIQDINNKLRNGTLEIVQHAGGTEPRNVTPQRRASKTISRMELGPTPAEALPVRPEGTEDLTPTTEKPDWAGKITGGPDLPDPGDNFADWIKNLAKNEEGTSQPIDWSRLRRKRTGEAEHNPEVDYRRRSRHQASAVQLSTENRTFIDRLPDEALENFIERQSRNPNYQTDTGLNLLEHARNELEMRQAGDIIFEPHPSQRELAGLPVHNQVQFHYERSRTPAQPEVQSYREDPHTPSVDYDTIAQQLSGMTVREAEDFVREMADSIYPEDLGPLIHELNRNPTASTREAVLVLENLAHELEGRGVVTNRAGHGAGAVQGQGEQLSEWEIASQIEARQKPEKSLDELEASKRTPALTRLGRMIGEDRAKKLVSGEQEIKFSESARRPRGKRLSPYDITSWGKWAKEEIRDLGGDVNPDYPGVQVIPHDSPSLFPNAFGIVWRNSEGIPMGVMKSGLDGKSISIFAVNPELGLRRGPVAFEMLKVALDRGATEPSGGVSDLTRNLIERSKRLIARAAREDSGEADYFAMIENAKRLLDEFAKSGVAQRAKRLFKNERGSFDLTAGIARLKELFQKQKVGGLTAEEFEEARNLARAASQAQASGGIPSSGNVGGSAAPPLSTSTGLTNGIPPPNIPPPGPPNPPGSAPVPPTPPRTGPGARQPEGVLPQFGPTRLPVQGPDLPGTPGGRMVSGIQPETPWDTGYPKPAQPAGVEPQLGPTRVPNQGAVRPRQPYINNNPQLVQDLQNRIRKALEDEALKRPNPGGPREINKILDSMQQVIRENPDADANGIIRQVMGANKALLTSWDLSAPGRQGKAFILNSEFWKALPGMVKAWGSKNALDMIQRAIEDHPSGYFKRGVSQSGKPTKSFAELVGLELSETEEMFRSTVGKGFEKYTGVGKSSRAHTAFLNKLRSDMFANFMEAAKAAGRNPETDLNLARKYAEFINDATGRSNVSGKLRVGKATLDLNDAFFAPKNMAGQIKTWNNVLNPIRYAQHDPVLRKQALRSLFAVAGVGMMTAEAANQIPGISVSHDPTSSDFMKIRIGEKRIDLFGGYQQFPVAAMEQLLGRTSRPGSFGTPDKQIDLSPPKNKFGQTTRANEAEKFFTNRLSPLGSFVWAWMRNQEFDGKPFEVKRALYERTLPIVTKDLMELGQADPAMAAMLAPLLITGLASTQVYTGR